MSENLVRRGKRAEELVKEEYPLAEDVFYAGENVVRIHPSGRNTRVLGSGPTREEAYISAARNLYLMK